MLAEPLRLVFKFRYVPLDFGLGGTRRDEQLCLPGPALVTACSRVLAFVAMASTRLASFAIADQPSGSGLLAAAGESLGKSHSASGDFVRQRRLKPRRCSRFPRRLVVVCGAPGDPAAPVAAPAGRAGHPACMQLPNPPGCPTPYPNSPRDARRHIQIHLDAQRRAYLRSRKV